MKEGNIGCGAVIGSITQAMRVREILAAAAIPANVVKKESVGRGCVYGISLSCSQLSNAQTVLSHKGIRVKQWNGRD